MRFLQVPKFENDFDIDWEFNSTFIKYTVYEIVYEYDEDGEIVLWEEILSHVYDLSTYQGGYFDDPYLVMINNIDASVQEIEVLNYITETSSEDERFPQLIEVDWADDFDTDIAESINEIEVIDSEGYVDPQVKINSLQSEVDTLREALDTAVKRSEDLALSTFETVIALLGI